ncbi:MAG: ATP-binding cassette domain-containing protein [Microthrixaceae bacterium]
MSVQDAPTRADAERSTRQIREDLSGANMSRRRRATNSAAGVAMVAAFLVAALPLVIMGVDVVSKGIGVVLDADWWTQPIPGDVSRADLAGNEDLCALGFGDPEECAAGSSSESVVEGMQPAIVGTFLTVLGASVMAIPLGVMGAVYLNEYGKNGRLARFIRFMTDVMVGVPSVVMGVFIYSIWVAPLRYGGQVGLRRLARTGLSDAADRGALDRGDAQARAQLAARGIGRARDPHLEDDGQGRATRSDRRDHLGLSARGRPCGGGDGAGGVHHRFRHHDQLVLPRPEHHPLCADLLTAAERRHHRHPACLGRSSYPRRDRPRPDTRCPWHQPPVRDHPGVMEDPTKMSDPEPDQEPRQMSSDTSPADVAPPAATVPDVPLQMPDPSATIPVPSVPLEAAGQSLASLIVEPDARADRGATASGRVQGRTTCTSTTAPTGRCANVSMDVRQHEITAFIGPSGCGKTTVLRCFNRMNDLIDGARVEGSIDYHGVDLYGEKVNPVEVRRRIGMVFQKPNPFPKSIYDNVAYGPRIAGVRKQGRARRDRRDAPCVAPRSGTRSRTASRPSALGMSGGQQQRLCIARAIAVDPEVDPHGRAVLGARPDRHGAHRGPHAPRSRPTTRS